MAAVLASGPDAVLSHWSAAALWLIRPNSRSIIDVTDPVKSRSWDGIRRHHKALPVDEVTVEDGIPVTTVPRTIFDLAATEPLDVVKALLREAEFRELHDRLSLWDLVERYPGRRGVRKVEAALEALKDEPVDERKASWRNDSIRSCTATLFRDLTSTTGSPSPASTSRSTASGPTSTK